MINRKNLRLMKPTAYLINAARGEIVDTRALVDVLKKKRIAGAALDVLEDEEELRKRDRKETRTERLDRLLMRMDNVLVTPHDAFNSVEAHERILEITIDNIKGFLRGKPKNVVPEA